MSPWERWATRNRDLVSLYNTIWPDLRHLSGAAWIETAWRRWPWLYVTDAENLSLLRAETKPRP